MFLDHPFFRYHICITSNLWTHLEHTMRTLVLLEWWRIMDQIFILQIIFYKIYSISWEYYVQLVTPWWSENWVGTFCHVLISNRSFSTFFYWIHYIKPFYPYQHCIHMETFSTPLLLKNVVLNNFVCKGQ
jgi:hypothetical protein